MRIYNGFSVSNGIVYGKVVTLFYEKNFIQDKISDNEKEREIIRFENLLSSYLEVDRVKVDDKKLENLLNVHIELIDDPFLKDTVKNKILTENKFMSFFDNATDNGIDYYRSAVEGIESNDQSYMFEKIRYTLDEEEQNKERNSKEWN